MPYSQDNEETVILEYFGNRIGRFLDIGAAGGVKFSNTRALAERGWGGVLVEPSPRQFLELWKLYGRDPRMTLVNVAVEKFGGLREFHFSPDTVVNTIDQACLETWKRTFPYESWWIQTIGIFDFMARFSGPYQFISVDAEGRSVEIGLNLFPYELGAELVCVEHDQGIEELAARMESWGYESILRTGNNTIWRRKNG